MEEKELWVNEVLKSMAGSKRAEPKPDLYAKIQSKLSEGKVVRLIPIRRIKWVAAVACLFIIANIYVFYARQKQTPINNKTIDNKIVTNYNLY